VLKPAGQGPDGDPVLLFFDGHTSRWNMSALLYLERNNVHGICLPSHTSIWSQPNDAGANASFKAFFGVTLRQTRTNAQASANRAVFDTVHWPPASARVCTPRLFFFNTVIVRLTIRTPVLYMQAFRRAFIGWRHKLEEGLRSSKACNAIKSAWKTVRCVFQAAQLARAVPPRIPHRPCPPLLLLAADPHSSRSAAEPALHRAPRDRPSFRSPSSAPSPPSARQVGLGGRLNRQCDSWRDAIIAFGRLPHVPGSSDAEAAHDPAGDAAAPGTSVWEQAQQAAADRLRTRLSALVAGKSLQLRRVVLDSGGDGVDDYIPSASAATAVGLAEAVRISVEGDTEELILNHAQIVDPSDARMCKLLAEFQCADDTVDLRKLGRKEGARARNAREKLEREEAARQGRAASERAIAALKAEAMQAGVTDDLWSRVRAQFERPPPQVMGNLLVYDAVALTEPIVLTRATLEAVGGALAMGHEPDRQPRPRAPNRRTSGVPQTGRGGCIERLRAGMQEADAEKARKKARLDAQAQAEREAKQQEKAARERQVQLEREDRSRQAARKQSEKIEKEDEALKGQALKAFEWMRDSGVWEFEELTDTKAALHLGPLLRWHREEAAQGLRRCRAVQGLGRVPPGSHSGGGAHPEAIWRQTAAHATLLTLRSPPLPQFVQAGRILEDEDASGSEDEGGYSDDEGGGAGEREGDGEDEDEDEDRDGESQYEEEDEDEGEGEDVYDNQSEGGGESDDEGDVFAFR